MIAQEPGLRFNRRLLLKEVLKILQIEKIERWIRQGALRLWYLKRTKTCSKNLSTSSLCYVTNMLTSWLQQHRSCPPTTLHLKIHTRCDSNFVKTTFGQTWSAPAHRYTLRSSTQPTAACRHRPAGSCACFGRWARDDVAGEIQTKY